MSKLTKEQIERAAKNGIPRQTLTSRLHYGWDIETAITTPQNTQDPSKKRSFNAESTSWFADGNNSALRCPVPDCGHTGQIITKAHCRIAHNMTRDEVKEKYGMPTRLDVKRRKVEIQ